MCTREGTWLGRGARGLAVQLLDGRVRRSTLTLEPGGDREVMMRMLPGQDFTADDIDEAEDPVIRVEARADGILVGGMSYPLVADRRTAAKSTRRSKSAAKSRKPAKNRKR